MRKILILIVAFILAGVSLWYSLAVRKAQEAVVNEPSVPVTLPTASSTEGEPLVEVDGGGYGDDVYEYSDDTFAQFFVRSDTQDTWTTLTEDGKPLSLNKALGKIQVKVEPSLLALMDQKTWSLYSCSDTSKTGIRDTVLSMRFALQENYQGNLFRDQSRFLVNWENTFFRDTLPLLFPKEYYATVPSQRGYFTTHTDYPAVTLRTVPVEFPDKSMKTIGYVFVGDELLIGSDVTCLLRAQEQLFDTGA